MCRDGDSTGCLRIELELALPPKPTGTIGIVTTRVLLDELVRRVVRTAERTGVEVQGRIAVMSKHLVHTHTNNDPVAVVTTKPINCLAVQRRRVSENRWGQRWRQWRRQRGRAHSLSLQASSLREGTFAFSFLFLFLFLFFIIMLRTAPPARGRDPLYVCVYTLHQRRGQVGTSR
jgi:hypothetical protein